MRDREGWAEEKVGVATLEPQAGTCRADGIIVGRVQKSKGAWRVTSHRLRRSHTAMFGLGVAVLLRHILSTCVAPVIGDGLRDALDSRLKQ